MKQERYCNAHGKQGFSNDLTGIRAAGNKLVNHKKQRVVLRGLNHAGTEYACVQGWGFFDGSHDMSLVKSYKAWKANSIRVPMNQDCWLGINGVKPEWSGQNYINTLTNYVNMFTQASLAVILELHWSAPGNWQATKQYPMPDRDHTIDFWRSVARHFSSNKRIIFELFNEPFPDNNNWNSAEGWRCWRDGGTCNGMSYQAAGMQELVNAVRGVGATNLILLGGLSYSNSLAQFNQYVPKDPQNNIAAAWHSYNFNKCNNEGCWNQYILPTVKKYPLITTEIGEDDCAGGYVTAVMKWLDANAGGNYLAWTFNTWDCREGPALISSYDNNGTPTPYGAAIKKHYASFNTHSTAKPNKNSGKKNSKKHHEPSPGGGKLGGGEQPAPGGRGFSSGGGGGGSLTGSPTPAGKHKHGKHNKDGGTKKSKQSPSGSGALTGQPKFNKSTEKHKHGKHNKNHNVVKTHGKSPKQELANKHSKQGVKNKPPKHGSGHGMKNKKPTNTKHTGSEAHHNSKHSTQPDKKTKKRHSKKQGNKKSKHSKGR